MRFAPSGEGEKIGHGPEIRSGLGPRFKKKWKHSINSLLDLMERASLAQFRWRKGTCELTHNMER